MAKCEMIVNINVSLLPTDKWVEEVLLPQLREAIGNRDNVVINVSQPSVEPPTDET